MLELEADQSRKQCRRKELADDGFEVGEVARQRMKRRDVAKAGGGQRGKAEIKQRGTGAIFRSRRWQAGEGVRQQRVDEPIEDEKEKRKIQIENDRALHAMEGRVKRGIKALKYNIYQEFVESRAHIVHTSDTILRLLMMTPDPLSPYFPTRSTSGVQPTTPCLRCIPTGSDQCSLLYFLFFLKREGPSKPSKPSRLQQ